MANDYVEFGRPHEEQYPKGVRRMNLAAYNLLRSGLLPKSFAINDDLKTQSLEEISTALSSETRKLIEMLKKDGYEVYEAGDVSPDEVESQGMPFWVLDRALENFKSPPALLAFKPDPQEIFISGSGYISETERSDLLAKEGERVNKEYPGLKLTVRAGTVSEWVELVWKHFIKTQKRVRLFGYQYGYHSTWATSYDKDDPRGADAFVGFWPDSPGLCVTMWTIKNVMPRSKFAPVIDIPRI